MSKINSNDDLNDVVPSDDTPLTMKNYKEPIATIPSEDDTETCRSCGQTGIAGCYPFSTLVGAGICDDCI